MTEQLSNDKTQQAYSEAVSSGLYAKKTGLVGKYDNVRKYWEDEITRHNLYPHLKKLINRCQTNMQRLRIMDLGCGSADGLELLAGIRDKDANLRQDEIDLLGPDILGHYKGVDISDDLLEQGSNIYGNNPKIHFENADFTKGLPLAKDEEPYDLYFSSYGSSSHHNNLKTLTKLLADIAVRTKNYSVIVCDWLGRYSYEWQSLWEHDHSKNPNMDYVVSYIYDKREREEKRDELQHLRLRFMCRQEIDTIIEKASELAGIQIKPLTYFDRSIFTGRHMDTCEYNDHAQPLRYAVNSLHETNTRTDLDSLLINYVPKKGFDFINKYFDRLQCCWNSLVRYTIDLICNYDEKQQRFTEDIPPISGSYPPELKQMMERMKKVVEGVGWLNLGLPRENIIEPQLAYALRHLIMELQQGLGCAHGFSVILEVDKN